MRSPNAALLIWNAIRHSLLLTSLVCLSSSAHAQLGGGGGIGGGGGFGGGQGGGGQGGQGGGAAGIAIDTEGLMRVLQPAKSNTALEKKQLQALAAKYVPATVNEPSPLRKISLVRLEQVCQELADGGQTVPVEIEFLAGLQRIDYVFVDPVGGDLILAGPAGGFAPNAEGRVVSTETGRPPLRLDDLITLLRTVRKERLVGCSIDPEPQRMADMQEYIRTNSTPAPAAVARGRYQVMTRILGLQNVSIWGVPPKSHAARVLVEADYRMKLITIGREPSQLRGFVSHLAMSRPGGNSMRRWWFMPLYESISHTTDKTAYELKGPRAQLMSQEEYADASGNRHDTAKTLVSSERYGKQFTERFEELAGKIPVFAELQNLIDLTIVSTLIYEHNLAAKAKWSMELFLDEERVKFAEAPIPRRVPSAFNYKMAGRSMVLGLIGGGVRIEPSRVVRAVAAPSDARHLPSLSDQAQRTRHTAPEQWWWD